MKTVEVGLGVRAECWASRQKVGVCFFFTDQGSNAVVVPILPRGAGNAFLWSESRCHDQTPGTQINPLTLTSIDLKRKLHRHCLCVSAEAPSFRNINTPYFIVE